MAGGGGGGGHEERSRVGRKGGGGVVVAVRQAGVTEGATDRMAQGKRRGARTPVMTTGARAGRRRCGGEL